MSDSNKTQDPIHDPSVQPIIIDPRPALRERRQGDPEEKPKDDLTDEAWTWPKTLVGDLFLADVDPYDFLEQVEDLAGQFVVSAADADGAPHARDCYKAAFEWVMQAHKIREEYIHQLDLICLIPGDDE